MRIPKHIKIHSAAFQRKDSHEQRGDSWIFYADSKINGTWRGKNLIKTVFLLGMQTHITNLEHKVTATVPSELKENQIFYNQ